MDDKTGIDDTNMAQALSARAGDRRAFAGLVRRHQDRMFGFLLRMLGTRDEAMDLTQDSFLKAWKALPDWRPEARFTTWLFQIARNAALDLLRHRQRIEFVSFDADPSHDMVEGYAPSPEKQFSDRQRISLLQRAVDMLPVDQREILLLRELEDMSYAELALILGISEGTVKSRLARARAAALTNFHHYAGESPDD